MASMRDRRRLIDPRAAKQLRPSSPKLVRNFAWAAATIEQFSSQHPDLAVREEENVLLAQPLGQRLIVHYAFANIEEMRRRFTAMLERVEAMARGGKYRHLYISFDDHPNRTFIEPLFRQSAFEVAYEWVYLLRQDLSSLEAVPAAPMVRPATAADLKAVAVLEAACYQGAPLGLAELRQITAAVGAVREPPLLVAAAGRRVLGYVLTEAEDRQTGRLARLGVHPEHRRRGVGYALLLHGLARIASDGRLRASAIAPSDSKAAVQLCRKAGFAPRSTVLLYAKEAGAKPKRTLGLIGIRGIWE